MDDVTDLAEFMVDVADSVCACLADAPGGAPTVCTVYWNAPPDDNACDCEDTNGQVVVWLDRLFTVEGGSLNPYAGPVRPTQLGIAADLSLRLIRPCWPGPEGVGSMVQLPSRAVTEAVAVVDVSDAVAVECCLLGLLKTRCGSSSAPVLTPDRNRAGCHGFTVSWTVLIGACCTPEAS